MLCERLESTPARFGTRRCPSCSSGASDDREMNPNEARLVHTTALTVLALVAMRLVAASYAMLMYDTVFSGVGTMNVTADS